MSLADEVERLAKTPLLSDPGYEDGEHEQLTLTEVAGVHTVESAWHGLRFVFDQVQDSRGSVSAELTVVLRGRELLPLASIGLKSNQAQGQLARNMHKEAPAIPWKLLLQKACAMVLKRHRMGEPVIILSRHTPVTPLTFVVNPFVYQRKITVLYGDGGKGKSTFVLFLGMVASVGATVAGIRALPARTLFLDYEDDDDIHALRLQALIQGHPELAEAQILYERCSRPIAAMASQLSRRIQEDKIEFLIVDSLFKASGGTEADHCSRFFDALRPLKIPACIVAHIPKPQDGVEPSIYGSVFNKNLARLTWEFRREPESPGHPARIGLYRRKDNYSPADENLGFLVHQARDYSAFRYEPCDLSEAAELSKGLPAAAQIRILLETDGMPRSAKTIADDTGLPLATVKSTLSREQGRKWHKLGEGHETQWTVLSAGK